MFEIPVLETERLILREPRESDVAHEIEFYQTDRSKFVGGPLDENAVWRSMAANAGHWTWRGYGFWAVEEKATGAYLGHVGLWFPKGWPEPEIGWTMMANAEGKGFASEAALASRKYAYEVLGWETAISLIDPANVRSLALAERLSVTFDYEFEHAQYGKMHVYRHPAPKS